MSKLTQQYREYLQSLQWHAKREAALRRCGGACQKCRATKDLEVHHKHYETFGREGPDDLEVLCIPCHDRADEERRRVNHRSKGMATYARKKYGDDWRDSADLDSIAEEFAEWRESRADY